MFLLISFPNSPVTLLPCPAVPLLLSLPHPPPQLLHHTSLDSTQTEGGQATWKLRNTQTNAEVYKISA